MRPTELWAHRSTKSGMQLSSYPIRTANCTVPQRNSRWLTHTGPLYGTRMWNAMNSIEAPIRIHSWSLSQKLPKIISGWWLSPTPLKNMTSSVGMIIIDYSQYMESHKIPWFQTTNQIYQWCPWSRPFCAETCKTNRRVGRARNCRFQCMLHHRTQSGTCPWDKSKATLAWRQAKGWPFSLSTSFNRVLVCFDYCLRHETVDCVADTTGE